MTSHTPQST